MESFSDVDVGDALPMGSFYPKTSDPNVRFAAVIASEFRVFGEVVEANYDVARINLFSVPAADFLRPVPDDGDAFPLEHFFQRSRARVFRDFVSDGTDEIDFGVAHSEFRGEFRRRVGFPQFFRQKFFVVFAHQLPCELIASGRLRGRDEAPENVRRDFRSRREKFFHQAQVSFVFSRAPKHPVPMSEDGIGIRAAGNAQLRDFPENSEELIVG